MAKVGAASVTERETYVKRCRLAALLCAIVTALTAATAFLGWYFHSEVLEDVLPGHVSMKPNTAICFVMAALGVCMLLRAGRWGTRVARLTASVVLALGFLSLLEYVRGVDLHIDTLLFDDKVQLLYPGRMAAVTAVEFCLAGLSLLFLSGKAVNRRLAECGAVLMTSIAYAAIVGFVYGVPIFYGATGWNSMALHTGLGFVLLGAALLLTAPDSVLARLLSAPERGSWVARRLFPALLLVPAAMGKLYLLPSISFRRPVFGVALFAVTIVLAGAATLMFITTFLNRKERQLAELNARLAASAHDALQSERELLLITDQLPTLLSYIDMEGRFVRVNRTYEEWLGKRAEEIIGKKADDLLGTAYWESTRQARESIARGQSVTVDVMYPTIKGERRAQVTYAPDMNEQGRLRGFACLVLDVHDRFQAEHALRQTEKLAAVGRLASSIAHEMNNPLESVTNLLYLAGMESSEPAEVRQYVDQAQTELARVTHIVTQTLRFHRQESHPVPCRISAIASQVIALYQGRLMQRNITVEERFRENTPLLCRDGEIRQVLANLIGNAVDAMEGGGRLLVRTRSLKDRKAGRAVIVTLADTGHGIGAATLRELFKAFHTTKGATGSGLGLWISKEIVDRHNGRITMRTSEREGASGTVFRVLLADVVG